MVQEFHVLKCYSCEAFQVHQVKKSKKWNCKMCGEKQSIIKVFGCGSGVECRRHVQKLNTRRGEMLEEQNQKAWSRWEEAEYGGEEDELKDKAQEYNHNTVVETQVSRWSKYLQEPGDEEAPEEEEEENVFMDRNQNPACGNARKRKRGQGGRRCQSGEEDVGTFQNGWRSASRSAKTSGHHSRSPSLFTPMERSSKASAPRPVPAYTKPPSATSMTTSKPLSSTSTVNKPSFNTSVTHRLNTTTSQPVSSGNNVSKSSKWAQFLTLPSPEEEEGEEEGIDDSHWGISISESSSLHDNREGFQLQDVTKATKGQPGYGTTSSLDCISSSLAVLGDGGFLKRSVGTLNWVKSTFSSCGLGEGTNREACPAQGPLLQGEEPVCHQAPPTKRPCPSLPVRSLFYTEEDFDDTF